MMKSWKLWKLCDQSFENCFGWKIHKSFVVRCITTFFDSGFITVPILESLSSIQNLKKYKTSGKIKNKFVKECSLTLNCCIAKKNIYIYHIIKK